MMKISKAKQMNGFLLSMSDNTVSFNQYFTAIEVSRKYENCPVLVAGDSHKATLHLTNPDAFWQEAKAAGVPVVYVSSSAREGNSIGAAA